MVSNLSHRQRIYWLFLVSVAIVIVANYLILRHNLQLQESDAQVINRAGRQRMLSQRIAKLLFLNTQKELSPIALGYGTDKLELLLDQWEESHGMLMSGTWQFTNRPQRLDSLFAAVDPFFIEIANSAQEIKIGRTLDADTMPLDRISLAEREFLKGMELIVREYQFIAEGKLQRTKNAALWLSVLSLAILVGEFLFILLPLFRNLAGRNRQLLESNRKLSDFAQIASHNFRAPVGNLKMLLELYQKSDDEADRAMLIEKVAISTDRLGTTMDVLTDSLKVRSGHGLVTEILEFDSIFEKVLPQFEQTIIDEGAHITVDFSGLPKIRYSRLYMESIFHNLISNALKYKSPERKLELFIKSYIKSGTEHLVFSDNGLGIDLERHGRKMFGLNKVFHRHPDAKGVGLFMTRTQIEAMGGKIAVESEVGKGTTFTITF